MLDSRFRGNDAPVVMPVKTGIQSSARDMRLILAPMPWQGEGGGEGQDSSRLVPLTQILSPTGGEGKEQDTSPKSGSNTFTGPGQHDDGPHTRPSGLPPAHMGSVPDMLFHFYVTIPNS